MKKYILSLAVAAIIPAMASADEGLINNDIVHASAGLETSHLWRGMEVSNGLTYNADLSFSDKSNHFRVGLWGGGMFNGDYKEFDYFVSYTNKGFSASVWDIYNFSSPESAGIFNYKPDETSHFIDAGISYNFGAVSKVPLTLSWNTIVYGCDRGLIKEKMHNMYSTFVNASVVCFDNEQWNVGASVGAGFALRSKSGVKMIDEETGKEFEYKDPSNFYGGHKFNVCDVRLQATYKLKIKNYPIPITVGGMWNPEANKGYFRAAVTLITL